MHTKIEHYETIRIGIKARRVCDFGHVMRFDYVRIAFEEDEF